MSKGNKSSITTLDKYFENPREESKKVEKSAKRRSNEEIFADFVKSQEGKYIKKSGDKYIVSRSIRGKEKVFAKFTNIEYAKDYERRLIIHGFDNTFRSNLISPYGKFIIKRENKFHIIRKIDGKRKSFGSFNELINALNKREELIDDNWGVDGDINSYREGQYGKYITTLNGIYIVNKRINGQLFHFGKFDTLENATKARDILLENNWDDSKIPDNLYSWRFFINYHPITDSWEIFNLIDTDLLSFGLFKNVDLAKKALDILISNDWDSSYVPLEYYHEYSNIRSFKRPDGIYYSVIRKVNDELVNFASFDNYEEALEFRNELLLNNWNLESNEEEKYDEYIYLKDGKFIVKNNGVVYGEFDRICDAVDFRLECIKRNWEL